MSTETKTITIKTPVVDICPFCGKEVKDDAVIIVSGHGRFRAKRYYHKHCLEEEYGRSD